MPCSVILSRNENGLIQQTTPTWWKNVTDSIALKLQNLGNSGFIEGLAQAANTSNSPLLEYCGFRQRGRRRRKSRQFRSVLRAKHPATSTIDLPRFSLPPLQPQ